MKISVIGDGGWGTALALLLAKKGLNCVLWGVFPEYVNFLKRKRENVKFLPGIKIPSSIELTSDLEVALNKANIIILAVPAQYMRSVLKRMKKHNLRSANILSVTKGIEPKTKKRMSNVIFEELNRVRLGVLSGPNIAYEVAKGIPSASVCASKSTKFALQLQNIFMCSSFRVYTSRDLKGVEFAGAFKNIIAIACGISDGLGFGTNTKAALLTRGLAEITRLGVALGAQYKTFSGLSGMGDLVTTCMSKRSRNRWLGEELGKGKDLNTVLKKTEMVIEGVPTTKIALNLAKELKICVPITGEVYQVLFNNKSPQAALNSLMLRQRKKET